MTGLISGTNLRVFVEYVWFSQIVFKMSIIVLELDVSFVDIRMPKNECSYGAVWLPSRCYFLYFLF